jgi:hypothetical protein
MRTGCTPSIAEIDVGTSERAMRVLAFTEPATYQAKFSM